MLQCTCGAEERLQMRDHFVEMGDEVTWRCNTCKEVIEHKVVSCSAPKFVE